MSAGTALRFLTYAPGRIGAGKVTHRSEHWRATLPCPMPLERQRRYGRSHPARYRLSCSGWPVCNNRQKNSAPPGARTGRKTVTARWPAAWTGEAVLDGCRLAQRPTAWLGWSDSNFGIRWDRNPPVLPREALAMWPKRRSRDCSRPSCLGRGYAAATGISACRIVHRTSRVTSDDEAC